MPRCGRPPALWTALSRPQRVTPAHAWTTRSTSSSTAASAAPSPSPAAGSAAPSCHNDITPRHYDDSSPVAPAAAPASSTTTTTTSTAPAVERPAAAEEVARALVARVDPSTYLASLLLPSSTRIAVWALRGLNAELARVREGGSGAALGRRGGGSGESATAARLRMAWWRSEIDRLLASDPASAVPAQPILALLHYVVHGVPTNGLGGRTHGVRLTRHFVRTMLSAREGNLSDVPPATLDALETYAEQTASQLLYLSLEAAVQTAAPSTLAPSSSSSSAAAATTTTTTPRPSGPADHLASHVGKAAGIMTVLRGIPGQLAHQRCYLPLDVMAQHRLSLEALARLAQGEADPARSADGPDADTRSRLADAVFDVATRANDHVITARTHLAERSGQRHAASGGGMGRAERAIVLPVLETTELWLRRLEGVDFNLWDPRLGEDRVRVPWPWAASGHVGMATGGIPVPASLYLLYRLARVVR